MLDVKMHSFRILCEMEVSFSERIYFYIYYFRILKGKKFRKTAESKIV